jgi:hypothetical protein
MITVFLTKSIITMIATIPSAKAVADSDENIIEIGTLESL